MSTFETYRYAFPNARLTRKPNGVLEVKFHTAGENWFSMAIPTSSSSSSSMPSAKTVKTAQ